MRQVIRQKIVDSLAAAPPSLTRRDVRLPKVPGKAVAVIGMRRSGKTTFLWQVLREQLERNTPREALLYFNFEDERLVGMTAANLQWLVEEYFILHPEWRDRQRVTFFLDEIQVVPAWETFARRLLDTEQMNLFLSGSSARLLSREVATAMRGRAMEALVHPFSFREYLRHHGAEPAKPVARLPKAARSALEKRLRDYLVEGGFPEAQGVERRDRFELLRSYVDTALFRDVVERHAVSNPVALRWMVRQLLGNAGGLFSVQKFYDGLRSQGVPAAKDTLHSYLAHLEDAFLVRTVPVATDSERRRQVNPRKAYPIDPGLIPVFDRSGKANAGHALETAVLLELERRGFTAAYVRMPDGFEVDFLAHGPEGEELLIQVCTEVDAPETLEREVRALEGAAVAHPRARPMLITLTRPAISLREGTELHEAAAWLLDNE